MDAVSLQVHQSVREAEEATGTIQGIEITAQDGTNYKVVFEKATGDDAALAATIDTDTNSIVVTLGTDGSGDLDAAKNTLTLVTSEIDGVTGLGAALAIGVDGNTVAAEGAGVLTGGAQAIQEDATKAYMFLLRVLHK